MATAKSCRYWPLVCSGGKTKNWWIYSKHLTKAVIPLQRLHLTKADRDVVQEIMMMILGDAALTYTTKSGAVNRSLSVSLPTNVNF